jgi:hypothetical protein
MLRTSIARPASRLRAVGRSGQTRGFAASYAEEEPRTGGGPGIGTFLVLAGLAAAGYYIYANDLLDDIIVRGGFAWHVPHGRTPLWVHPRGGNGRELRALRTNMKRTGEFVSRSCGTAGRRGCTNETD